MRKRGKNLFFSNQNKTMEQYKIKKKLIKIVLS
jgi:hypothetical protein